MEMLAGGARRIVVEDAGEVIGTVTPDSIIARMSAEDQTGDSGAEDQDPEEDETGFFRRPPARRRSGGLKRRDQPLEMVVGISELGGRS